MKAIENAREWLKGKKAYLLVAGAIVAAAIAWADGGLTTFEAVSAIWAALFGGALRAGVSKSAPPADLAEQLQAKIKEAKGE